MRDLPGGDAALSHGFRGTSGERRPRIQAGALLTADRQELPAPERLFADLRDARGIVLAVSGGPDSTALMHLAAAWRPQAPPLWVGTVDHGLQPASRSIAETVANDARRLGLDARILTWAGPKPSASIQETARTARYRLLNDFARETGATHVALAHTMDDQAETLLMRLAGGSGPSGLVGMRPLVLRDGILLARPLLALPKAALIGLCEERGWPFSEDPANRNPRYARSRWRALAATLAREGLTARRLSTLSHRLARAEAALMAAAAALGERCTLPGPPDACSLQATPLFAAPDELSIRVLATGLEAVNPEAPRRLERLERLDAALRRATLAGAPLRRTLHGCLVSLDRRAVVTLRREGTRTRGTLEPRVAAPAKSTPGFDTH